MPDIRTTTAAMPACATKISGSPTTTVHAPSVTVFTNIAGAVSVTVDQAGIDAGRRLRSSLLPENIFNPFRGRRSKIKRGGGGVARDDADEKMPSSEVITPRRKDGQQSEHLQLSSTSSAAAASSSAHGIKDGVREALDLWALQT